MAYIRGTGGLSAARAYEKANNVMTSVKATASQHRIAMVAETESRDDVVSLLNSLAGDRAQLITIRGVAGIGPYAKDQQVDPTYDVVAEFDAVIASIDAAGVWIQANFPVNGSGWAQSVKFGVWPVALVRPTFTSAQTAALQALLATLDAAII